MNSRNLRPYQRGATLIVGLIFLVALTLLGVMAMKSSVLQERMAGGSRDRSLAVHAAEAALRDAKRDILGFRADGTACVTGAVGCRAVNHLGVSGSAVYQPTCPNGLCRDNPCAGGYAFGVGPHIAFPMTAGPSVVYGTFTGAANIAGVNTPPRYLIEYFTRPDGVATACDGNEAIPMYRITVRAVGANPNTVVMLQEVFTP
jgi:type IV pilus assembly protein PilX